MIVVDTSALMAIALREPLWADCMEALASDPTRCMSAGTLAEAFIVSAGRGVGDPLRALISSFAIDIAPVTEETAARVQDAYLRWGRGYNRAALNFGDCFSYSLAMEKGCPLLFIGNDFSKTDVQGALKK